MAKEISFTGRIDDERLVRAIIYDKWSREELVEEVLSHIRHTHLFSNLLQDAKAEGYRPRPREE